MKSKKILKSTNLTIHIWIQKNVRKLIYSSIFIFAIILILLSFIMTNNWINVCSGVGTGLLTSLIVSVIINAENNAREKRKRNEEKHFVLNDIIKANLNVYEDVIYRVNEFITLTGIYGKPIYELYENFSVYDDFEDKLKTFDIINNSPCNKKSLNNLFDFKNYRIDSLVAELKRLPKSEYYLKGILNKEEFTKLTSNFANDTYLKRAALIQSFEEVNANNREEYIKFLRMTIYICSNTISCFSYAKNKARNQETFIKKNIDELDYFENYIHSDDYWEEQRERFEYDASHPDQMEHFQEELEESINETDEERVLKDLYLCICGFDGLGIDELLSKLDADSQNAIALLRQEDIQKFLKKNRKLNTSIVHKFGKDYLKK